MTMVNLLAKRFARTLTTPMPAPEPPPAQATVLLVDDEPRSQEALRRTLDEDFTVFGATSAAEATAILRREEIHIILCDQRMPGTSGIDFLKAARVRWPDAIRIVLSGYTDAADIIAGINDAGIWQYLTKPWSPEQLVLTLRRAAGSCALFGNQSQRDSCRRRFARHSRKRKNCAIYDPVLFFFKLPRARRPRRRMTCHEIASCRRIRLAGPPETRHGPGLMCSSNAAE